jgi:hypothetical protein
MFTLFNSFRVLNSVQIFSLDLSQSTLLYDLNDVALLKHIFNLTTALIAFSAGNVLRSLLSWTTNPFQL